MSDERTILLVDDVEMFRELGSLFLARAGRVLTASSGEEGIEIAQRVHPDVILIDLLMPDLDGDAVCRFIKSDPDLHDTPVVMLVGADEASEWGRAVRAGADDVLAKPISRVSLNESVRRFTRGNKPTGLPRINLDTAVQLRLGTDIHHGRLRNLSRGGLFIETDSELEADGEVGLEFVLPETTTQFNPTARIIWKKRDGARPQTEGLGMRFVDISSDLVRTLEDYVFDRALGAHSPGVPA